MGDIFQMFFGSGGGMSGFGGMGGGMGGMGSGFDSSNFSQGNGRHGFKFKFG